MLHCYIVDRGAANAIGAGVQDQPAVDETEEHQVEAGDDGRIVRASSQVVNGLDCVPRTQGSQPGPHLMERTPHAMDVEDTYEAGHSEARVHQCIQEFPRTPGVFEMVSPSPSAQRGMCLLQSVSALQG